MEPMTMIIIAVAVFVVLVAGGLALAAVIVGGRAERMHPPPAGRCDAITYLAEGESVRCVKPLGHEEGHVGRIEGLVVGWRD